MNQGFKRELYFSKLTKNGPIVVPDKTMDPAIKQDFVTPFVEINLQGSNDMLNLQVRDLFQRYFMPYSRCRGLKKKEKINEFKSFIKQKYLLMMNATNIEEKLAELRNVDGLICEAFAYKDIQLIEELIEGTILKALIKVIDPECDQSIYIGTNCIKMMVQIILGTNDEMKNPAFLHIIPNTIFKLMKIVKIRVFNQTIMTETSKQIFRSCLSTLRIILEYIPFRQVSRQFTEEEIVQASKWMISLDEHKDYLPHDLLDCIIFHFYEYVGNTRERVSYLIKDLDQFKKCLKMLTNYKNQFLGLISMIFPLDEVPNDFLKEFLTFYSDALLAQNIDDDEDELEMVYGDEALFYSHKARVIGTLASWIQINENAPRWILEHNDLLNTLLYTYNRQHNSYIQHGFIIIYYKLLEVAMWMKRKDPLIKKIKQFNFPRFLWDEMNSSDQLNSLASSFCLLRLFKRKQQKKPANNRYYKTFMSQLREIGCPIFIFREAMKKFNQYDFCVCSRTDCLVPLLHQNIFIDELNHYSMNRTIKTPQ